MAREPASPSTAKASSAKWSSSANAPAPVGRARKKARSRPVYQELLEQGRTEFLGYNELEADVARDRPAGRQAAGGAVEPGAGGIVLDHTPFYAEAGGQVGDRGALYLDVGREGRRSRTAFPGVPGLTVHRDRDARADPNRRRCCAPKWPRPCATPPCATTPRRTCCTPRCARCWAPTSSRRAAWWSPAACASTSPTTPPWTAPSRGSGAPRQRRDPAQHGRADRRHGPRPGHRNRRHGAVRREVRRQGARGLRPRLQPGTLRRHPRAPAPATSASARSSTKAASRRACAASKPSPAIGALRQFQETTDTLHRIADMMRASEPELIEQVEKTARHQRALERQVDQLKNKLAQSPPARLEAQARAIKDVQRAGRAAWTAWTASRCAPLADSLRNKWKTGGGRAGLRRGRNVAIVSAVTKDLTGKVHAGKLVGAVAQAVGGKGGGRPDMAEAGGKDPGGAGRRARKRLSRGRGHAVSESFDVVVIGAGPTGLACGIELEAARRQGRPGRQRVRGQFALPLPHAHDLLHHAGAARDRRHPDDEPQRKAEPHRGAEILPPRGRTLQARCPPVRAGGPIGGSDGAFQVYTTDRLGCPHTYHARKVILATGYYDMPNRLNVPGEELAKVIHYYKEPHPYYNHDVL